MPTEAQLELIVERCESRGSEYRHGVCDTYRACSSTVRELAESLDDGRGKRDHIDLLVAIAEDFSTLATELQK